VVSAVRGAQAQALATLLENSLVHGEGTTTVLTRPAGAWSVVEVSDEGPGVPEELGTRVFERSVSGARSSGLGLALARTLVAADGGRLELVSARPAVFAMFLPAAPAGPRTLPETLPSTLPVPEPEAQTVVAMTASSAASGSSGNTQRR
jgi:signal transduction histidine kinase